MVHRDLAPEGVARGRHGWGEREGNSGDRRGGGVADRRVVCRDPRVEDGFVGVRLRGRSRWVVELGRSGAGGGVNRNTIVSAFEVLCDGGWLSARSTAGTFVAGTLPVEVPPAAPQGGDAAPVGFDLPPGPEAQGVLPRSPGRLLLLGGVPDLRLVPRQKLARAYGNALRGARGRRLLDYGDARGNERLRQALCELLSRVRGIRVSPASICTVRGSQQGLYLAARVLLRPGDVVAVEALGYPPAWQAVRLAGAEPVPIEVDGDGIDVNALEALCHRTRVRAVVVTPHHQCPTTATLSPERRTALLALARRHRLAVIEDDYDYDFHYDGLPVLPLAARDDAGVVVYIGTLSKGFAPGLRLGYVAGPSPVIERIAGYRSFVDQQGDQLLEQAVATLLEDGDLQRHVRQTHRAYRARRDVLCQALNARLPALTFQRPAGGMAIWAHAAGIDVDRWVAQALVEGVAIQSGRQFRFDGGESAHVRIGFAACNEGELVEAVGRLASSWEAVAPPLR